MESGVDGVVKVLLVAGARPNFMKIAPIMRALASRAIHTSLVHTGQHYDYAMSQTFFDDLELPPPQHFLEVGSGSHAVQTARIMERFEPVLIAEKPDWLAVVGDVNSTLACALVASKLKTDLGCRIAHVEAGLRSNDWRMPEEVNRVLTDRISDLLLIPSHDARPNLLNEGIEEEKIVFAGNVMIDTVHTHLERARALRMHERYGLRASQYAVVTLHRPSNVDDPERLRVLLGALTRIAREIPIAFPVHPRTRKAIQDAAVGRLDGVVMLDPLGYTEMLGLTQAAHAVLTDSGGLQEETTALGIPCVTLREQTERPVTITHGTNRLAPWPLTEAGIVETLHAALAAPRPRTQPDGWDGHAAERIADAFLSNDRRVNRPELSIA
jgi:UDP-N-acetylglucosamine 2-epimerase (non-hydrolysing)